MATLALEPIRLVKTYSGQAAEYEKIAPSASLTFIAGDLALKTNNAFSVCGADPTIISYLTQCTSSDAVPGDTSFNLLMIKPEDTFEVSAFHSTPASAVVADSALDGQSYFGLIKSTVSGVTAWCLDLEETTTDSVQLLGRSANSSGTDVYPRVFVKFIPSILTQLA